MINYTKEQFLADVAAEATALKEHATKEELKRIIFENFNLNYVTTCIYGLATDSCLSVRASELILKCCKRYFYNSPETDFRRGFENVKKQVMEQSIEGVSNPINLKNKRGVFVRYLSSIEAYILTPEAKNKNLIDFLNGKREDLVL